MTNRANTNNGRIELDLSSLAVGQYQVTLTNATEMQTTKVLIQR